MLEHDLQPVKTGPVMAMGKCFSLTKPNYHSEWERMRCYCGWNGNKNEKNIWLAHGYSSHDFQLI